MEGFRPTAFTSTQIAYYIIFFYNKEPLTKQIFLDSIDLISISTELVSVMNRSSDKYVTGFYRFNSNDEEEQAM
jgi:hypothetical protein